MPRGDHMGPNGQGSMSGRGLGLCSGSDTPGYVKKNVGFRRGGIGCRRGGGGGGRRGGFFNGGAINNQDSLKQQKAALENQLKAIDQQIED